MGAIPTPYTHNFRALETTTYVPGTYDTSSTGLYMCNTKGLEGPPYLRVVFHGLLSAEPVDINEVSVRGWPALSPVAKRLPAEFVWKESVRESYVRDGQQSTTRRGERKLPRSTFYPKHGFLAVTNGHHGLNPAARYAGEHSKWSSIVTLSNAKNATMLNKPATSAYRLVPEKFLLHVSRGHDGVQVGVARPDRRRIGSCFELPHRVSHVRELGVPRRRGAALILRLPWRTNRETKRGKRQCTILA